MMCTVMLCKNILVNDFYEAICYLTVLFINNEKFFDHHIVLTKIQSVINNNKKTDTK